MRDRGIRPGVRRLLRRPLRTATSTRADADEELADFLEARVADLMARGASEADARAEALRRLGGSSFAAVQHHHRRLAERQERRMRIRAWLGSMAQDVRFGARQLARAPLITAIAVTSLAVGIGANVAIFALVDAVLLRTLPVERPNELVAIGKTTAIEGHGTGAPRGDLLSLPLYHDLEREPGIVTGLAASGTAGRLDVRFAGHAEDEHPNGRFVSANFFSVLGVPAERGRVFGDEDGGAPGASPVAVISDAYWRRRFGGTNDVVGQRVTIDGAMLTIVGVARRGFAGDIVERPTEIWLPIEMQPIVQRHAAPITDRGTNWLLLLGRLAPGVTLAQARAGFTTRIRAALLANAAFAGEAAHLRRAPIVVSSGARGFSAARVSFRAALLTVQIGVVLLLLIVCTNLANLLLGRTIARQAEMSVRLALGAGRGRLLRQVMTESALLALLGACGGVAFAWWGRAALARLATTTDSAVAIAGTIDARVLAFALGVSVLAVLCFGLAPALRASHADIASPMRAHARSVVARGVRIGRVPIGAALVPLQVALCVVLLAGAALLVRSLRNVESADPGLDRDHLVLAQVDNTRRGLTGDRFITMASQLGDRLAAIPGVRAVTYSQNGLYTGQDGDAVVAVPGFVGRTKDDSTLAYDLVGPEYLHAIGARMIAGRDVTARDVSNAPSVTVLNESAAQFLFGGDERAIGRVVYFDAGVPTTVVGVVADVHDHSLTQPVDRRAYAPYAQQVAGDDHPYISFEIRTAEDPAGVVAAVRRTIAAFDPTLPQIRVSPVPVLVAGTIRNQQLVTTVAAAFGVAALVLALLGLYGVMSYAVARRTAELGLRSALGAGRADVLRLVLGDGLRLVAIGVVTGVPLALSGARLLRAQLHGVAATDPASFGVAVVAIAACAFAAALVPALRASRVSPAVALAHE